MMVLRKLDQIINHMSIKNKKKFGLIILSIILVGCQNISFPDSILPQINNEETVTSSTDSSKLEQPAATPTIQLDTPRELVIWVPPHFDPAADNESGRLLSARLEEFQRDNPHLNLIVRVKTAAGSGSLLETLMYANAVAEDAVPEVIALSRGDMLQAISKNLVFPIEDLSTTIDDSDWYDFSRNMGIFQGTTYGLPFASNVLGIIFQQGLLVNTQPSWEEVNRRFNQIIIPIADPDALVTLALYLSTGGEIVDAQGHQTIDVEKYSEVLSTYDEAYRRGVLPLGLAEIQTDDQAWAYFETTNNSAVISWASRIISNDNEYEMALLPSLGSENYSLATGWVWCLAALDDGDKAEAIRLMEFLIEPDFLRAWSPVSGFLPARPSSLAGWNDSDVKITIGEMLETAHLRPNREHISSIAPEIKNSVLEIIMRQSTPEESAQKLLERLEAIEN